MPEFQVSSKDYSIAIEEVVKDAIAEAEGDRDKAEEIIRSSVEYHEYTVYTGNAICVLFHSKNDSAYFDEFGADGIKDIVEKQGWDMVYTVIANHAFSADCLAKLDDLWEEPDDDEDDDSEGNQ